MTHHRRCRSARAPFAVPSLLTVLIAAVSAFVGCDATSPDVADGMTQDARLRPASPDGRSKADICHYAAGSDSYRLITVGAAALSAHLAHGDARPSDRVPTMRGYAFDESCRPYAVMQEVCLTNQFDIATFRWNLTENLATGEITGLLTVPIGTFEVTGTSSPSDVLDTTQEGSSLFLFAEMPDASCPPPPPDSFSFTGSRTGATADFSGTYESYCAGNAIRSGEWTGTFTPGPCGDITDG